MRHAISELGGFRFTTPATDLASKGDGFFVVTDQDNQSLLTRAGSFVKDATGILVNTAGFTLLGYNVANDNGVPLPTAPPRWSPSTLALWRSKPLPPPSGKLFVNMPPNAAVVPAGSVL